MLSTACAKTGVTLNVGTLRATDRPEHVQGASNSAAADVYRQPRDTEHLGPMLLRCELRHAPIRSHARHAEARGERVEAQRFDVRGDRLVGLRTQLCH